MRRILTAAVLISILWTVIKIAPLWAFTLMAGLAIVCGVSEVYTLLSREGRRPFGILGMAATAGVVWAFSGLEPVFSPVLPVTAVAVLAPVASMWTRKDTAAMMEATGSTLWPVLAVGLTLSHMVAMRTIPGEVGEDLLILLFVCVTFSDTAAFVVGSLAGKRRMAPRVSPAKSWEGAGAGIAAAMGGGLLAHFWFYQDLPIAHAAALGLILGGSGILGDLAESMVKRATGTKDSSRLLPGHGGMMDRLDSLMISAPVLYYYYRYFLEGAS